jgi:hypothetical protein
MSIPILSLTPRFYMGISGSKSPFEWLGASSRVLWRPAMQATPRNVAK